MRVCTHAGSSRGGMLRSLFWGMEYLQPPLLYQSRQGPCNCLPLR